MEALEKELKELEIKEKPLNGKQEKFCREYVLCLNKGKAYSLAYNYPYTTEQERKQASSLGCRLYENVRVQARIRELVEEANKNCNVSLAFLVQEQIDALAKMKEGKKEKKLDIEGNVVDTGEIEIDFKAINGAIKNLADMTGLSKKVIEASVNAKQDITINKIDALAETLFKDE